MSFKIQKIVHLQPVSIKRNEFRDHHGALAQLARAFDWQSRGHRFDSDMLHMLKGWLQM